MSHVLVKSKHFTVNAFNDRRKFLIFMIDSGFRENLAKEKAD